MDEDKFLNMVEMIKQEGNENLIALAEQHMNMFENSYTRLCSKIKRRKMLRAWWRQYLKNKENNNEES